jgi:hypothetical protein
MALRKFREFIRDQQRSVSGRIEQRALKEEIYDTDITNATSVYIGSGLSAAERRSLSESFISKIEEFCESGQTVIAVATAVE